MTIAATPRTGHQYTITHGDYVAVITELGAALRKLTYQGKNVIATFGANEVAPASSGQLLIPYPNRIEDGVYTFEGKTYELPIDEHERRNAIHGYGYRAYWTLENLDESTVTLSWRVPNMAGYPFDVMVAVTYTLTDNGLNLTIAARNNGETNAPWALAIHPWLANGFDGYGDEIDGQNAQCSLMVPADTHVTVDDRLLPTGTEPVDGTKYDFREPMKLDQQPYDDAWTDVKHAEDGTVTAVLYRPDGMAVEVGGDETITSFQVCTGTGFAPDNHPAGVAVEPQTAYANAFRSGKDVIVIKPGEVSSTTLFIRMRKA